MISQRSTAKEQCYICDTSCNPWSLLHEFSEVICRGCANYEGSFQIEKLIEKVKQLRSKAGDKLINQAFSSQPKTQIAATREEIQASVITPSSQKTMNSEIQHLKESISPPTSTAYPCKPMVSPCLAPMNLIGNVLPVLHSNSTFSQTSVIPNAIPTLMSPAASLAYRHGVLAARIAAASWVQNGGASTLRNGLSPCYEEKYISTPTSDQPAKDLYRSESFPMAKFGCSVQTVQTPVQAENFPEDSNNNIKSSPTGKRKSSPEISVSAKRTLSDPSRPFANLLPPHQTSTSIHNTVNTEFTGSSVCKDGSNSMSPQPSISPTARSACIEEFDYMGCFLCSTRLDESHFVQCPTVSNHKFCFPCSRDSIKQQGINAEAYCPSGKRCRLSPNLPAPWAFVPSEISQILNAHILPKGKHDRHIVSHSRREKSISP